MENFDDGDDFFSDDDSFEDGFEDDFSSEDSLDNDIGIEDEPMGDDQCDDEFTTKEAVIFGMAMNFAYEEGLEEAQRRKLEKKMDNDQDQSNNGS